MLPLGRNSVKEYRLLRTRAQRSNARFFATTFNYPVHYQARPSLAVHIVARLQRPAAQLFL